MNQSGLTRTPTTAPSTSPPRTAKIEHVARVVLDLRDVDVLLESFDPAQVPLPLLLLSGRREELVDLLRRSAAFSSAGSVTNSPSRATSALFERRFQKKRTASTTRPRTSATMSGRSTQDWRSSSLKAGL